MPIPKTQHEVIAEMLEHNTAGLSPKEIASRLNKSTSTLYKWAEDPEGSGFPIPSEMIIPFTLMTQDRRLIEFYCHQSDSVMIPLIGVRTLRDKNFIGQIKKVESSFYDAIRLSVERYLDDLNISDSDYNEIKAGFMKHIQTAVALIGLAKDKGAEKKAVKK